MPDLPFAESLTTDRAVHDWWIYFKMLFNRGALGNGLRWCHLLFLCIEQIFVFTPDQIVCSWRGFLLVVSCSYFFSYVRLVILSCVYWIDMARVCLNCPSDVLADGAWESGPVATLPCHH